MKCPACTHTQTKVIETREAVNGLLVRRRRECESCLFRFSTHENVKILNMSVLKSDNSCEPYQKEKIQTGLQNALKKRDFSEEQFSQLMYLIERDIQMLKLDRVPSIKIGEIIMDRLEKIDAVAYIRFASVYKSFDDLKSFTQAINNYQPSL